MVIFLLNIYNKTEHYFLLALLLNNYFYVRMSEKRLSLSIGAEILTSIVD